MALESPYTSDFAARQAHNQRCSAALVFFFILFFLLIGGAVDFLHFDTFSSTASPIATIIALSFATISTAAAYYGGSDIILASLGAEKLNLQIPEHRELHNIVTEMALASGSSMPRVYVIFDPAVFGSMVANSVTTKISNDRRERPRWTRQASSCGNCRNA